MISSCEVCCFCVRGPDDVIGNMVHTVAFEVLGIQNQMGLIENDSKILCFRSSAGFRLNIT